MGGVVLVALTVAVACGGQNKGYVEVENWTPPPQTPEPLCAMTEVDDAGILFIQRVNRGLSGDGVGEVLDIDDGIAMSIGEVAWPKQLQMAELVALAEEAQKVGSLCARRVSWLKRDLAERAKRTQSLTIASYVSSAVTAALLAGAQLIKPDSARADTTAVVGAVGGGTTAILVGVASTANDNENIQQIARRVGEIEGAADSFRSNWQRQLETISCSCEPDGGVPDAGPREVTCEYKEWDAIPHPDDCTTYAKVMANDELAWVTESRQDHYHPFTKSMGQQCRLIGEGARKLNQNLWNELHVLRGVCDRAPIFVVGKPLGTGASGK